MQYFSEIFHCLLKNLMVDICKTSHGDTGSLELVDMHVLEPLVTNYDVKAFVLLLR